MTGAKGQVRLSADRAVRFCLGAIVALLAVLVVIVWAEAPSWVQTCQAAPAPKDVGIPDSGAQRNAMISVLEAIKSTLDTTNQKLDKIAALLESGKVKVVLGEGGAEKAPGNVERPK